jgi:sigma-B regulation protein RsbU (phosphoserine phosphatase)
MLPNPDAMTALPVPRQPSSSSDSSNSNTPTEGTAVSALKELVARLHREQHKIQDLLSSLGFALRSFNNLNQFLELIPLMAARVTDADGGALILFKPNGQVRLERLHCQEGQACQDIRRAIEKATRDVMTASSDGETDSTPVPLELIQASLDEHVSHSLGADVQLFGTPILVKNGERGRLYVFTHDPNYAWTPTRQKLVRLVADQTAVAIANDELTVELRKKERLDRELEIGADIQLRLLPRQCPEIEGVELAALCKTANRVGGDYYDFIPTNYDQLRSKNPSETELLDALKPSVPWSLVIGDVMGKGVPAGLIMTMTRGMLRAEVLNRHSPGRILHHLNRVMYADLENSHRFVTLFYSEYDPKTQILSYSNAAHNPPLLWQASTRSIIPLDTEGMLIGLEADSQYEDAQVQLAVGDTIIYYTDGFTDAANQNGDRFDEENLTRAFQWACEHCPSSQAILDYLFEQVQQFIGSTNRNGDDMTLVVMQVKSSE